MGGYIGSLPAVIDMSPGLALGVVVIFKKQIANHVLPLIGFAESVIAKVTLPMFVGAVVRQR